MLITIPAAVLQLHRFVSGTGYSDVSNITNLRIEEGEDNTYIAIATDGHRLVKLVWNRAEGDEPGDLPIHLPAAEAKRLAATAKKVDTKIELRSEGPDIAHVGTYHTSVVLESGGKFPDWRQVLPKGGGQVTEAFSLNPKYLAEAMQHAEKWVCVGGRKRASPCVVADVPVWGDALSPIQFSAESSCTHWLRAAYILMPMRL
jgi:DNA polymerase III sliding clamp (beta) subunit (PCNA family)